MVKTGTKTKTGPKARRERPKKAAALTGAASNPVAATVSEPAKRPVVKPFRFGFLVHDVSRMRRTLFDEVMKAHGVSRSQWHVLATLSRVGSEGLMQVDIANLMDVGKVTIGGLIERLEAGGFVERRLDPKDRRARRVYVTERGFEVIGEMQKEGLKLNKSILAGVSSEHLAITEDVLAAVKANIRGLLNKPD
jgi:DNA-binding MarR family transcriptional regulator